MWVTIGGVSVVDHVDGDSVAHNASVSDPLSTFDFSLDDPTLSILLDDFQEVIVWDETQTHVPDGLGNFIALIPSMNYMLNPSFYSNGGGTATLQWTEAGPLPAGQWNYNTTHPNYTFSNNILGYTLQLQNTPLGKVIPGVSYMLSVYVTGAGTISNIQSIVKMDWYDLNNNLISSGPADYRTPGAQTHISVSGVAPATAAYAQLAFGGQTTVAGTNSGQIIFGTGQMEPMWFTDQGVSYPTLDCNIAQLTCVQMPDGTTSRRCRIFTGMIDDLEITYEGNQRFYDVKSIANSSILEDYALINSSYTAEYDTFILNDVVNTFFSGVISTGQLNLFAPASTIVQGQLIDSVVHVDMTFREVLNYLSNVSGFLFYLDPYYYLHYVPQYYDVAVFQLSDTPDYINSFPYESYTLQKDGTTRGNAIKLVGNKQNAAAIVDTFTGDNVTTVFPLTKPPFTVHLVTIFDGTNTNRQHTGIAGVDVMTGTSTFVALINKQNLTITFKNPPIGGHGVNITVDYTYEDAVIAIVQSGDSFAKYGRWFYRKVNDSNMTSTTSAIQRGIAEVTKYAFPAKIPKFTTNNLYIPVGSTVLLSSQHDNLNQVAFTVQTVSVSHLGGGFYLYQYTTGRYNPSLIDHFRNTHKALNRPGYTSNVATQIVTYDSVLFDTITWNDVIVANPVVAQPSGKYGSARYGFFSYS